MNFARLSCSFPFLDKVGLGSILLHATKRAEREIRQQEKNEIAHLPPREQEKMRAKQKKRKEDKIARRNLLDLEEQRKEAKRQQQEWAKLSREQRKYVLASIFSPVL